MMSILCIKDPSAVETYMYATPREETLLWRDALSMTITRLARNSITNTQQTVNNNTSVNNNYQEGYVVQLFYYLVSPGETITDIASLFNLSVPWIQGCNAVPLETLQPNSYVIIPYRGELPSNVTNNPVLMQANTAVVSQGNSSTFVVKPSAPVISDTLACKICFEKQINTVLLECGHAALCSDCAKAITGQPCPFCRRPVSRVIVTYRA